MAEIDYLNRRQADKLISSGTKNIKHKTIMLVMLDCGLRVSETITLKYSNFDFRRRTLTVRSLKKKGEEKRTIPVSDRLYNCLAEYTQSLTGSPGPDDYLFPGQGNGHISRKTVWGFMDRIADNNPELGKLHPHTLRHTFATHHLASGTALHNIKLMLGHENYNTTLVYAHTPIEVLRRNVDVTTQEKLSFWQKVQKELFPEKKATLINLSSDVADFIVGRNDTLLKVIELVNKNCNTILIGSIGVGKSHIINQIRPGERKVLKIDDCNDIKKTLIQCLLYLYGNDKQHVFNLMYPEYDLSKTQQHLQKDSIASLCKEIKDVTQKHEYLLVIDNVDRITPKAVSALEQLKDHFTILTSAREIPLNKQSFLWNFEVVKVDVLSRQHSLELIHKLSYDMEIEDFEMFRNHIYEQANGNPRVVYELVDRYRKEIVITPEVIRTIRHTGSLPEYDMSLAILLLLGGMAILRYLSNETGNDSLKFIGGCAMILLIISRYFFRFTKRRVV